MGRGVFLPADGTKGCNYIAGRTLAFNAVERTGTAATEPVRLIRTQFLFPKPVFMGIGNSKNWWLTRSLHKMDITLKKNEKRTFINYEKKSREKNHNVIIAQFSG